MPNATQSELDAYIALRGAVIEAKDRLQKFLSANPGDPDTERLQNLVVHCGNASTSLAAHAIGILGNQTAPALTKLKAISAEAKDFVKQIAEIKKGLKVVTSLLTLAGSVMIGDVSGVLTAVSSVKESLNSGPTDA